MYVYNTQEYIFNMYLSYITLPNGLKDVQDVRNEKQLCDIIEKRNYW